MIPRRQRGFILLYVVVMVAALTLIIMQVNQLRTGVPRQTERQLGRAIEEREALLLLDFVLAGMRDQKLAEDSRYAQFRHLLATNPDQNSDMEEELAQLKAMLDQLNFKIDVARKKSGSTAATVDDAKGRLFIPETSNYKLKPGDTEYSVHIIAGNRLPNLNALPYDNLWRYLAYLGLKEEEARQLAANLVDWRDADDFRTDGRGAEREYYQALTRPYSPRNAPIRDWQELAYVRDVTPDRLQLLRDNFILGDPGKTGVYAEGAKPEMLSALTGLKLETINAILNAFSKGDAPISAVSQQDSDTFDRLVTWREDTAILRIEIVGPHVMLHMDYDLQHNRPLGRW